MRTVSFLLSCLLALLCTALHAADPLPSWNEGPAKQAIVDFIRATTFKASPHFVPEDERIATFDQDGTLWVEHPLYTQLQYCLDRVAFVAKQKPELQQKEPYKTVLSGDPEAIAKLTTQDLEKIAATTLTGMTTEAFQKEVAAWLATAKDPRWKRPYTDLTYLPMQELLQYFRASGYKTYIVTGRRTGFCAHYTPKTPTAYHQSRLWERLLKQHLPMT